MARNNVQMSLLSLQVKRALHHLESLQSSSVFVRNLSRLPACHQERPFCSDTVDALHPSTAVRRLFFLLRKGARLPPCRIARQLREGGTPAAETMAPVPIWALHSHCSSLSRSLSLSLSRRALLETSAASSSRTLRCVKVECQSTEAEADRNSASNS